MGECVWAEPGRIGRILTGREKRGNSKGKTSGKGRCGLPLFDSGIQSSSATALINCFNNLLHSISTIKSPPSLKGPSYVSGRWYQTSFFIS